MINGHMNVNSLIMELCSKQILEYTFNIVFQRNFSSTETGSNIAWLRNDKGQKITS